MSDEEQQPVDVPAEEPKTDLEVQCAQYLEGWKRALADYENVKKTIGQAKEEDRRRVRVDLAELLLPVIDNFGHALKFIPDTKDCPDDFKKRFDVWVQGITYIDKQFSAALAELGVEPIESVGKPFDANVHESGGSRKEEGKAEHEILEEVIKGWKIGEIVLRPAKVIVNQLSE